MVNSSNSLSLSPLYFILPCYRSQQKPACRAEWSTMAQLSLRTYFIVAVYKKYNKKSTETKLKS